MGSAHTISRADRKLFKPSLLTNPQLQHKISNNPMDPLEPQDPSAFVQAAVVILMACAFGAVLLGYCH